MSSSNEQRPIVSGYRKRDDEKCAFERAIKRQIKNTHTNINVFLHAVEWEYGLRKFILFDL